MPTLSICLITKNEAAHLTRCLESVRGLWDELIVVDTGSSDRTIEIARSFGARVFEVAWPDDFSAARNVCLEHATGDWILSIDADESIAARDHAPIRALLSRDDLNAVLAHQRHYLTTTVIGWVAGDGGYEEGKPYPGYFDVECRRLFRNKPWLRWRNRVHEELLSTDPAQPIVQEHGGWIIHHFGKVSDRDVLRAKNEAYIRIGLKKIEDQPDDPQAYYEQGLAYGELGLYAEARPYYQRAHGLSRGFRDTALRLAICDARIGDHKQALAGLRAAARALPQHAAVIAAEEGNVHRAMKNTVAAEQAFRRALGIDPALAMGTMNLALLLSEAGRHDEALACVDAGLRHNPAHPSLQGLRSDVQRSAARAAIGQGRFADARTWLDQIPGDDAGVAALRGAIALGTGDLQGALTHLRASLALEPTHEAAVNLSAALAGSGDAQGALEAAAEACRLLPDDEVSLARFARLAGDAFRRPSRDDGSRLTVFFYQRQSVPFDGRTPRERGLGGTESAIVYLAEALARTGHRVVVFNTCPAPVTVDGVEYAPWETLPVRCVADRPGVLVGVRYWRLLGQLRLAPLQIFWTGDAHDQPFLEGFADARGAEIDLFMLQSDWQEETFRAEHRIPAWRIARTKLGPAASAAAGAAAPAVPGTRRRKLAYASTPFRGLDVLLDLFPRIRAACPDAELDVFSSMRVYGMAEADDRKQFGALYAKAEQPGVTLVGSVPQPELAERLRDARVLAYPNHYRETFCIAAIEAEAAGCAVVTSAIGALPETVGDGGVCIAGDPRDPVYQDAFVEACVALLRDDQRWRATSARALRRAWTEYAWPVIAGGWNELFRTALAAEPPVFERVAVHLQNGRAALAYKMLQREARPETVSAAVWEALQALVAERAGESAVRPSDDTLRLLARHRSLRRVLALTPLGHAA